MLTEKMKVFQVGNGLIPPSEVTVEDFAIDDEGRVNGPNGLVTIGSLFGDTFSDPDTILRLKDARFIFSPQDERAAYELNPPKKVRGPRQVTQRLTDDQVRAILKDRAEQKLSFGKIGINYQISTYTVQKICKGQIYNDVESPHREAAFKVDRSNTRKLTDEDVLEIRRLYEEDTSIIQMAADYNCSTSLIKDVVLGKSYADVIDPNTVELVDPIETDEEEEFVEEE